MVVLKSKAWFAAETCPGPPEKWTDTGVGFISQEAPAIRGLPSIPHPGKVKVCSECGGPSGGGLCPW